MNLLEREQSLIELSNLLEKVEKGCGQTIAVCGEAGIGKTSLIEFFTQLNKDKVRILWGACDDLFTPRPLAPLYDIVLTLQSRIIHQLDLGISRPSIFTNLFEELQNNEPNIIVIEDVHWADESSLDLIKFLGRRINKCRSLLLITYRDDEVGSDHPLKLSLSSIPAKYFKRIKLTPLSREAVQKLAKSYGRENENIYLQTGGNPFLVTEVLTNSQKGISANIKDSLSSKLNRLQGESRSIVETISVIPGKAEKWLIDNFTEDHAAIDKGIEMEILKTDGDAISFKHELARLAVEELLPESKKIKLNTLVLNILLGQEDIDHLLARIVHHASKANNKEAIIKYAPLAAKQASKLGAHFQASKHYLTALQFSNHLSIEEQLNLLDGRSYECYLTGQIEQGVEACETIIEILKKNPDAKREGENYRRLSRLMWYTGQDEKGEDYLNKAIEIFEKLPEGKELAMAYSNKSQIYLCREETELAVKLGEKAIELARKINDADIEAHALNNIGTSKMFACDDSGEAYLKKSLEISIQHDFHDHISRAYDNLGSIQIYRRNLGEADKYFSVGIDYCLEKDLDTHGLCMTAEIAKTRLFMGKWDEAIETANMVLNRERVPVIDKVMPLTVVGIIRARRNDPGALTILNEANNLAMRSGETGKIVTVKAALAETFWLKGKLENIIDEIESFYKKIKDRNNSWAIGELAFWLWKGKKLRKIPGKAAKPFLLQIKGEWKQAAKLWEQLKCPYEQALALSDGNEESMKKAIEILDRLGASATSQLIKQKMRSSGMKSIPKGPRQSTKENPAGLTSRQLEVLNLLTKGLTNSEIANKLYISPKTVDHHISAVLSKLNIHSRIEAAAIVNSGFVYKNMGKSSL